MDFSLQNLKINFHTQNIPPSGLKPQTDKNALLSPPLYSDLSSSLYQNVNNSKYQNKTNSKTNSKTSFQTNFKTNSKTSFQTNANLQTYLNSNSYANSLTKSETYDQTNEKSLKTRNRPLASVFNKIKPILTQQHTPTENMALLNTNSDLFDAKTGIDDFESIHPKLRDVLKSFLNSDKLTVVQRLSWTTIQSKRNTIIKSPSGTGKTLAFLVPIIDSLIKMEPKISRDQGIYGIILVPTKELAKQITDILTNILRNFVWIVSGGLFGCDKRKAEKVRIRKGLNIIVATPGRLHDHLIHTKSLALDRLQWFIVDEADLLLDMGYEKKFAEIKNSIPNFNQCQKIFLSATITNKFYNCFKTLFNSSASFVDAFNDRVTIETDIKNLEINDVETNQILESSEYNYPTNLKQKILEIPTKLRLVALIWLLKYIFGMKKEGSRVIMFFNSIASATFHQSLLSSLKNEFIKTTEETETKFYLLHGSMEIKERMQVYESFSNATKCVMFTTDVASRGLDFPMVDWIIQFNPAREIREYVHRVGRACRMGNKGDAVIFLEPQEMSYVDLLYKNNLKIETLNIHSVFKLVNKNASMVESDANNLFSIIRKEVSNEALHKLALSAFNASLKAYTSYPKAMRSIFNLKNIHQGHLADSFALKQTPKEIQNMIRNKGPNNSNFTNSSFNKVQRKRKFEPKINLFENKTSNKLSLQSASALLSEEFKGGIVTGPGTKKANRRKL